MKKEKVISDVKTGVAVTFAAASLSLNSCRTTAKQLTPEQLQTIEHRTDSAQKKHHEYTMADGLYDLCESRIKEFREANKTLVKRYSRAYIDKYIQSPQMRQIMLKTMNNEFFVPMYDDYVEESDFGACDIESDNTKVMRGIRNEQRWYYDLLLYLSDKYTDRQLLNSEFFKIINNPALKRQFEYNTRRIEEIKPGMDFAVQRKAEIHKELVCKYTNEEKQKQR